MSHALARFRSTNFYSFLSVTEFFIYVRSYLEGEVQDRNKKDFVFTETHKYTTHMWKYTYIKRHIYKNKETSVVFSMVLLVTILQWMPELLGGGVLLTGIVDFWGRFVGFWKVLVERLGVYEWS